MLCFRYFHKLVLHWHRRLQMATTCSLTIFDHSPMNQTFFGIRIPRWIPADEFDDLFRSFNKVFNFSVGPFFSFLRHNPNKGEFRFFRPFNDDGHGLRRRGFDFSEYLLMWPCVTPPEFFQSSLDGCLSRFTHIVPKIMVGRVKPDFIQQYIILSCDYFLHHPEFRCSIQ
jgi:hypothetical protein